MKVWYQSLTELEDLPDYRDELARRVTASAPDGLESRVVGLAPGTYSGGSPISALVSVAGQGRVGAQVLTNAITAESEGFDVMLIGSFVAPGLRAARSAVGIPVLSMAESCVLASRVAARSVRLIALNADQCRLLRELLVRVGLGPLPIEYRHLGLRDERELSAAIADPAGMVLRVEAVCADLPDSDADLIVPAEGVLAAMLGAVGVTEIQGRPVMDVFAVALADAAAMGWAFSRGALAHGRHTSYPMAPRSA
jgi:hypothetical protein